MTASRVTLNKIYEDSCSKWRKAVFVTSLISAGIIFFTEIIIAFILDIQSLRPRSLKEYLFWYLFLPTVANAVILAGGYILMKIFRRKERVLNYIPIIQLVLICMVVSMFHYAFTVTFCTFSIPIVLSNIFNDKQMSRRITVLSLIGVTAAQFVGPCINHGYNEYVIPTYCVTLAFLLGTGVASNVLSQYQEQKDRKIEAIYRSRMEALEPLKYDQKTGLCGHTSFQSSLRKMVEEGEGGRQPALAVLDIDDFKAVNDTYGHAKGDVVLMKLAEIMKEACGEQYVPARFGGEEFSILFCDGNMLQYLWVVERIRSAFERASYDFTDRGITLSAGLSEWKEGWDSTEFFDAADEALYVSKRQGKNRITVKTAEGTVSADMYRWLSEGSAEE